MTSTESLSRSFLYNEKPTPMIRTQILELSIWVRIIGWGTLIILLLLKKTCVYCIFCFSEILYATIQSKREAFQEGEKHFQLRGSR